MMVAMHDSDTTGFSNLALMKLSAWHRQRGDSVCWFSPLFDTSDKVYSSRVFTWTADDPYLPECTERGGSGYGLSNWLPDEIEHTCPDYDLYGIDYSMGFLTRGCPRQCAYCIVPDKEGDIRAHADIDEFLRHGTVILMDNNVLACDHGIEQIDKLAGLGVKVDFNQGLDARLIDSAIARKLAALRWVRFIRLACDSQAQKQPVERAINNLRAAGYSGGIFCYVLVRDVNDAHERVEFLRGLKVDPFAQPFRDPNGTPPSREQRRFARWVNHKAIFKTVKWNEYRTDM